MQNIFSYFPKETKALSYFWNHANMILCIWIRLVGGLTFFSFIQLSLPKGLTFRTQKDSRHPRFHTFIITREDGSRTFGATYVFYEEVGNKQICAAMQTLQSMFQAETGPSQHRSSNYPPVPHDSPVFMKKIIPASREKVKTFDMSRDKLYVTKCICLVTQMPYVRVCKMYLKQLHEAVTRPTQPPMPLECYVYNMLYEIPLPPPGRCMKLFGVSGPIFCQRPGEIILTLHMIRVWAKKSFTCKKFIQKECYQP